MLPAKPVILACDRGSEAVTGRLMSLSKARKWRLRPSGSSNQRLDYEYVMRRALPWKERITVKFCGFRRSTAGRVIEVRTVSGQ